MKICISAESTIDLHEEDLEKYNIKTTPFNIVFGDRIEKDRFGISKEIFEYVDNNKTLPKTSAVSPEQFKDYFIKLKKEYDYIIHFSMSSNLSCAYNNANMVASEIDGVYVIDTKSLSTGIALLAIYARELAEQNIEIDEIVSRVSERIDKVNVSLVLDKLNYMHKGGRCSTIALLGANLLKIKPQLVLNDGRLILGKKYRGSFNKVVENYTLDTIENMKDVDKSKIFITHTVSDLEIVQNIKSKFKTAGFKNVYITNAGGTISSHCGPDCVGILYMNK